MASTRNSRTQMPGTVDEQAVDEFSAGQLADKNNRDTDIQAAFAEDYPDGGWRAWLVVLGVCAILVYSPLSLLRKAECIFRRQCAAHFRREF